MANITLLDLPFDVLSKIFKSLTLSDLSHVMLTCKTLRNLIAGDNAIWRSFSLFIHPALSPYTLCRISYNWCNGIYKPKILNLRTKYMPWLKLHNSESVFVSLGSKLICYPINQHGLKDGAYNWSVEVPKVQRNDIRTNDVSRFIFKNDLIVCGNRDGCAIVYEFMGTKQKPHLRHHILDCHNEGQSEVSAVELIDNEDTSIVVTASSNSPTLCYWHIRGNGCNQSQQARRRYHDTSEIINLPNIEGLRCMALNGSQTRLALGPNGNSKPLLLDVATSKFLSCLNTTLNSRQAVRDIQFHDENTVFYVTHSGKLQFIDTRTYEVVFDAKDPFLVTLYCARGDGARAVLAGSAAYSRCVLYDTRRARSHVQMYFTTKRSSPIYSLDFDSTKLIAAADLSLTSLNFDVWPDKRKQRDYSSFDFKLIP